MGVGLFIVWYLWLLKFSTLITHCGWCLFVLLQGLGGRLILAQNRQEELTSERRHQGNCSGIINAEVLPPS